jgi:hypothetical protein
MARASVKVSSFPVRGEGDEQMENGKMENGKMEKWKKGKKMEKWKKGKKNGKMEKWKNGKMEKWKNGKMEKWKIEKRYCTLDSSVDPHSKGKDESQHSS